MRTLMIIILLIGFGWLSVKSQEVSNMKSRSVNGKIEITYTMVGVPFDQEVTVSIFVSQDKGKTFRGPLKVVSGNVGRGIRNGKQTIIWDALKERFLYREDFVFEIRTQIDAVSEKPGGMVPVEIPTQVDPVSKKPNWMISIVGNTMTPFGLRLGTLRRVGWYIEGRANRYLVETARYSYSNGRITDFNQPGYFALNQDNHFSALSVIGGINYQPVKNVFLYAGAGYGKESFLIGVSEYTYNDDRIERNSYALQKENSVSGIELDAGVIYRIKMVVISAGAYSIDFSKIFWIAGIGFVF